MRINEIKNIGKLIRRKRKEMGITQKYAAGLCNVGVRFFLSWKWERISPYWKVLKVLNNFALELYVKDRGIEK